MYKHRVNYTRSGGSLSAASYRTNERKNELLYPATIKYNPLLVYSDTFDNLLSLLCGATKFIKKYFGHIRRRTTIMSIRTNSKTLLAIKQTEKAMAARIGWWLNYNSIIKPFLSARSSLLQRTKDLSRCGHEYSDTSSSVQRALNVFALILTFALKLANTLIIVLILTLTLLSTSPLWPLLSTVFDCSSVHSKTASH